MPRFSTRCENISQAKTCKALNWGPSHQVRNGADIPHVNPTMTAIPQDMNFTALQMLTMGLIGELMIRFYFEVQHKDYYVVENILNDTDTERL